MYRTEAGGGLKDSERERPQAIRQGSEGGREEWGASPDSSYSHIHTTDLQKAKAGHRKPASLGPRKKAGQGTGDTVR